MSKDTGKDDKTTELMKLELQINFKTHNYQRMTNRTYKHMLDRMNKDLISLTLTINAYSDSLKSKSNIYTNESNKQMQARQEKL